MVTLSFTVVVMVVVVVVVVVVTEGIKVDGHFVDVLGD